MPIDGEPHLIGDPGGYCRRDAAFGDQVRRVTQWVERYLVQHGHRLTDSAGRVEDAFVSAEEALVVLRGEPGRGGRLRGLRPFDRITEDLAELDAVIGERLLQTTDTACAPLADLAYRFRLDEASVDLLVAVTAFQASLDVSRLFRFAWADFTVQQPTVGFLLDLIASTPEMRASTLAALWPTSPLVRHGLISLDQARTWDGPTPLTSQRVRVPDPVQAAVEGRGPASIAALARDIVVVLPTGSKVPIASHADAARLLREGLRSAVSDRGPRVIGLVGRRGSGRRTLAAEIVGPPGVAVIEPHTTPGSSVSPLAALRDGLRDAWLLGAVPVVCGDAWLENPGEPASAIVALLTGGPGPVLLLAEDSTSLRTLACPVLEIAVPLPSQRDQVLLWESGFHGAGLSVPEGLGALAESYPLCPGQIRTALADLPLDQRRRAVATSTLLAAVRRQLPHQVARLAERADTTQTWDDLVLPEESATEVRYLITCARQRLRVYEEWNFKAKVPYGRTLSALLHGPPGTGKTMAAGIVARELGRELFRVDLSRVVDKYIGETEKNLGKLFDHAEQAQAVLLFDEADALFARRTEVKSSNDRYANLSVNYLLQRMEAFEGITLLTTNFSDSLDEALARRIAVKIKIPMPDAALRATLWRRLIPAEAPLEPGIRWVELAEAFELTGGYIKSAVLRAAFLSADAGQPISFAALWNAAVITYREMGKLVTGTMTRLTEKR